MWKICIRILIWVNISLELFRQNFLVTGGGVLQQFQIYCPMHTITFSAKKVLLSAGEYLACSHSIFLVCIPLRMRVFSKIFLENKKLLLHYCLGRIQYFMSLKLHTIKSKEIYIKVNEMLIINVQRIQAILIILCMRSLNKQAHLPSDAHQYGLKIRISGFVECRYYGFPPINKNGYSLNFEEFPFLLIGGKPQ